LVVPYCEPNAEEQEFKNKSGIQEPNAVADLCCGLPDPIAIGNTGI